jgi:hypothetical protein
MDFINRVIPNQTQQPQHVGPVPGSTESPDSRGKAGEKHKWGKHDVFERWSRIGSNVLLFVVALLIATVAWLIFTASPAAENSYINTTKMQAVFLNTGQIYFGNIKTLNNNYVVLDNIYYLQTNGSSSTSSSSTANQSVSLIKLGCELHKPYDQMIINNSEILFWENIQSSGQVGQAVASYQKAHPNGQTSCTTPTSSSNSVTNLQSSTPTAQ